jgi:oxygen-dependent protoporphyrinogen oxidase
VTAPGATVAVVGAGIAGGAAARALRRLGHPVVVFEAADQVGGRASTHRESGFTLDTAASFLLSSYERGLSLTRELGGGNELVRYRGKSGFHDGERCYLRSIGSRSAYLRLPLLSPRDKARFAMQGLALTLRGGPSMFDIAELADADDGTTVAEWARSTFGEATYQYVMRPSIEGLTGYSCEDASAATGKALLNAARGRGVRFHAIKSGTGALCQWLLRGSEQRLGCPVRSVSATPAGIDVNAADGPHRFDGAIVATDASGAADLIQLPAVREALSGIRYTISIHVAFAYEEDPWPAAPADAIFPVGPNRPADGTLALLSRKWAGLVPAGAQMASVYFEDWASRSLATDTAATEAASKTIERLLGMSPRPSFQRVFRRPRGVPIPEPGSFGRVLAAREALPPNLRLAGDYVGHQGVEGAIRSAEAAARSLSLEISR